MLEKKRSILVLLVVLAMVFAACGDDDDSGSGDVTDVVVLAPNPSAVIWYGLCSAIYQGFAEDEGLNVSFEAVDGSGAVLQAMAAGQAEFGIPGPGPLLSARAEGEDFVAIYNQFAQALFGLVVPADSGFQTVGDLKTGEKIVIGVGTAEGSEVTFVRPILVEAGLVEGVDYDFLPVGDGGPATAAFERGEIVAYAAATPDMAIIEARGLDLLELTPPEYKTVFGNGFATTQELIDSDPELVQGFINALVKGSNFAAANPDAAEADCAQMNPEEATDPALARALLDLSIESTKPLFGKPYGYYDPAAWAAWNQSLVDDGTFTELLENLEAAYTNEFVDNAYSAGFGD